MVVHDSGTSNEDGDLKRVWSIALCGTDLVVLLVGYWR